MSTFSVNPIMPGFAPDPSVVKVGEWFFLVNSTFHIFPGLPIYASQDLVNWKHICNAIHRPGQLSLIHSNTFLVVDLQATAVMLSQGGLYAPTIRHHEGTYYVICTNVLHKNGRGNDEMENFIVSTKDIWSGEWSDPVFFDFNGIDTSLFFDESGKVYIQGSSSPGPMTKIKQLEVDLKTGSKLSEERLLWEGTGGIYPEGPHIYKREGWYYLLISEGGTYDDHMITIARSKDIWGPYEACPHNPILTARGTDEYIQFTGHCDAFDDGTGQWWGTCLGVRKGPQRRFIMGRETFLTKARWENDWLVFDQVRSDIKGLARENGPSPLAAVANVDNLYIRDPNLGNYNLADDGSALTLKASSVDLSHPQTSPSFVGKRQRCLEGKSTVSLVKVDESWKSSEVKVGLSVYKDEHRYLRVYYDASESVVVMELVNNGQKLNVVHRRALSEAPSTLDFAIEYTEQEYRLSYGLSGDWNAFPAVDTLQMTDPDFVGPVIGVFAVATSDVNVSFKDMNIS